MRIIEPSTPAEFKKYIDLRYELLRKPWGRPYPETVDNEEHISSHFLLLNGDEAIGTGRLQYNSEEEGQIRAMSVRDDMQGKGLGRKIVERIEQKAREKKLKRIVLDARQNAVKFYEALGYKVVGDSYMLWNIIPHFRMEKDL